MCRARQMDQGVSRLGQRDLDREAGQRERRHPVYGATSVVKSRSNMLATAEARARVPTVAMTRREGHPLADS